MFKNTLVFCLLIIIISCSQKDKTKLKGYNTKYFKNGNIKEKLYLGNNVFDSLPIEIIGEEKIEIDSAKVCFFNDSTNRKIGSIDLFYDNRQKTIVYYLNGVIGREGFSQDTLATDEWKYYSKEGVLETITEFKIIKGKSYVNQEWYLDKIGDTIGGYFFKPMYKDTITLNSSLKAFILLSATFNKHEKSKIMVCTSNLDSIDFNEDFSNEDDIALTCAYDMETNKDNKNLIKGIDYNLSAIIQKKIKTLGKKRVRGIIYEYLVRDKDSLGLDKALENAHKMYFEIPVFVKDSI